jgi:hypothetical protein
MRNNNMDRDIPFEELEQCYYCGKIGAFDFMGDYCCAECLAIIYTPLDKSFLDDDDENGDE